MAELPAKKTMSTGTKVLIGCLGCGVLLIGAFVLFFVVGIAMVGSSASKLKTPVQTNSSNASSSSGGSNVGSQESNDESRVSAGSLPTVGAPALNSKYKANEVAADEVYKGKTYIIVGRVSQISKDAFDNIWVGLDTGELLADVHCSIPDSEKNVAMTLSKGQIVVVRGEIQGMVLTSVMVNAEAIRVVNSKTDLKRLQTEPW